MLKHNSHASYAGRFSDNGACKAYAKLYRKADLLANEPGFSRETISRNLSHGDGEMARWDGRISKSKVLDECKAMGITFDPLRTIDNGEDTSPQQLNSSKEVVELGRQAASLTETCCGELLV